MALLFSSPKGPAGALIELDSPTGNILSPVVEFFGVPDPAFGAQTDVAINPGTGNDAGPGTVAQPLRTMGEFNRRYAGLLVTAAATLQLVGNVLDAPLWLRGTSFGPGASLTVLGTVTALAAATITLVTGLNTAGATLQPFQLTTTGIDWTTVPLGSRLLASNGTFAWIRNVIDANNVIVGSFASLVSTSVVPTAGLTLTVQALSQAQPPNLSIQALDSTGVVTMRDLAFVGANVVSQAPFQANVLIFACEIQVQGQASVVSSVGGIQFRSIRWTMLAAASIVTYRCSGAQLFLLSAVWSGATTGTINANVPGGFIVMQHATIQLATLAVSTMGALQLNTSCNINHTTTAVIVDTNGFLQAGTCVVTGTAGSGVGIDLRCGLYIWTGAGGRPTISGATADCRVALVPYTYAALGQGKTAALLDAIPPTVTPVVSGDLNRGPGIATLSRAA